MTPETEKIWRVIDVLNWSKQYLTEKGVESPQVEAEWILREVLDCSRVDIYLRFEQPLSAADLARCRQILQQRVTGIPLQYVLGYTEFMGHRFSVTPDVLIPRQETEVIVERTLALMQEKFSDRVRILDVGTGSGNIIISLLHAWPQAQGKGIDSSAAALKIAAQNARTLGVADRLQWEQRDVLRSFPEDDESYEILISNPPYVAGEYFAKLPASVQNYEPHMALNPGDDALVFYRRLTEMGHKLLSPDGFMIVEIGGDYQEKAVRSVLEDGGYKVRETVLDYLPQSRALIAWRKERLR